MDENRVEIEEYLDSAIFSARAEINYAINRAGKQLGEVIRCYWSHAVFEDIFDEALSVLEVDEGWGDVAAKVLHKLLRDIWMGRPGREW